jgi:hypothetical protein
LTEPAPVVMAGIENLLMHRDGDAIGVAGRTHARGLDPHHVRLPRAIAHARGSDADRARMRRRIFAVG